MNIAGQLLEYLIGEPFSKVEEKADEFLHKTFPRPIWYRCKIDYDRFGKVEVTVRYFSDMHKMEIEHARIG